MQRKIVLLTEGFSNPHQGKTARNLLYYKPEEVMAVFDRETAGKRSGELFGAGDAPVISTFDEAIGADTLIIGVAPPGGLLPFAYKKIIEEAIKRRMNVVSGLHTFLSEDEDLVRLARQNNVTIFDVRKNDENQVVNRKGIKEDCLRIQTVGNDSSLGKMVTSFEIAVELKRAGYDAKFVATGQTGIMIEGDGCPIDSVVGDYINGAAEKLVLKNQHHKILLIEGQGSLVHPRYSSVTLGLLHGCMPHGMIMCYEVGRKYVNGLERVKIPPLKEVIEVFETMANIMFPSKVIGIAINSRKVIKEEADKERIRIKEEFGLPACDVIRHEPDELVNAILDYGVKLKFNLQKEMTQLSTNDTPIEYNLTLKN